MTSGYSKPCRSSVAGIRAVYLAQLQDVSSYTLVDGEITAISMAAGGERFWKWDLENDLSNATYVQTVDRATGSSFCDQTVNMTLNDNRKATRNQIMLMAKNDLFVIVEQIDGDFEAYGVDFGATLATATRDTGIVKGDRNGNLIVLKASEKEAAYKVDSTIVNALLIPTS
jgi:hypothetical protein